MACSARLKTSFELNPVTKGKRGTFLYLSYTKDTIFVSSNYHFFGNVSMGPALILTLAFSLLQTANTGVQEGDLLKGVWPIASRHTTLEAVVILNLWAMRTVLSRRHDPKGRSWTPYKYTEPHGHFHNECAVQPITHLLFSGHCPQVVYSTLSMLAFIQHIYWMHGCFI